MTQELVIEAGRTERHYWQDLWRYRELFQVLAWRDVSVRYKRTVIGIAWALIRPFLMMVVFTVIFDKLLTSLLVAEQAVDVSLKARKITPR